MVDELDIVTTFGQCAGMTNVAVLDDPVATLLDTLARKYPNRTYAMGSTKTGQPAVLIAEDEETIIIPLPFVYGMVLCETVEDVLHADATCKLTVASMPSMEKALAFIDEEEQRTNTLAEATRAFLRCADALGYAAPTRVRLGAVSWGQQTVQISLHGICTTNMRTVASSTAEVDTLLTESNIPKKLGLSDFE